MSDAMIAAACPHGDVCAGCPLLELTLSDQLAHKQKRLADALLPYAGLRDTIVPPVNAAEPSFGYRTRAKWMTGARSALGLYAKTGEHRVIDIPGCLVASALVREVGETLRTMLRDRPFRWFATFADGGALHAVDVREIVEKGVSRALVTLVVDQARAPEEKGLRAAAEELLRREPRVAGVAANLHLAGAVQVLGPTTLWLGGAREAVDESSGPRLLATYGSFVQAHPGQARKIHEAIAASIRPQAGKKTRILDLYGGSGGIALALAKTGADVSLVESFAPAAEMAARASVAEKLRVRALPGDAATVADRLANDGARFDLVVVNPPRRGLSPETRAAIARLSPPTLAYLSCEPTTLARDLDALARLGLGLISLSPFDMIPQTSEVETLALLERRPIPAPAILHEDDDVMVVDKPPHEPTTPQGEHDGSLLARVRRMPGMSKAAPVHRLDVGTSGACIFARSPRVVSIWAKALGADDAKKTYLAVAKGITSPRGSIHRSIKDGPRELDATTRYVRVAVVGGHSLLEVSPEEGRTHQIRKHLAALGHPILGDARYGHAPSNRFAEERHGLDHTFLHCASIDLTHPRTGERIVFTAELPGDLAAVLAKLRSAPPSAKSDRAVIGSERKRKRLDCPFSDPSLHARYPSRRAPPRPHRRR